MSELAAVVWEKLYPDRRKWSELEPSTQAEWVRVVEVVKDVVMDAIEAYLADKK